MKTRILFQLILLCTFTQVTAQKYTIDSGHSSVQIQVERFGVVDVIGRFKDMEGSITYLADNPDQTKANAIIAVESYDANNKGGEDAVKSVAFLDAAKFPTITFDGVSSVVKDGKSYLKGNLTIHGVSNEIMLPYEIKGPLLDLPTQKQSIAFNASIVINRQDYGVNFNRKLPNGIPIVGDDVKITIRVLAIAE